MNPILEKTFVAGAGGVTKYAVVVAGANDGEVVLPGGAGAGKIIGVAQHDASAGQEVRVMLAGRTHIRANGAVSMGDFLMIASSAGDVMRAAPPAHTADAPAINIVGIAQNNMVDGEIGVMLICIGANPTLDRVYIADGDITQYAVVVAGSSTGTVALPGAAGASKIMGVAQNAAEDGDPVVVRMWGITKVINSGGSSQGDFLTIASEAGDVMTLSLTADTNAYYCGIACEDMEDGQPGNMLIQIGIAQGEPAGG